MAVINIKKKFYLILVSVIFAIIFVSYAYGDSTNYAGFNLSLNKGWNFISFPLNPVNNEIRNITGELAGRLRVYYYANSTWEVFDSSFNDSQNNLDTMEYGKGYLIKSEHNQILRIFGSYVGNHVINLSPGWNMVGYNYSKDNIPDVIETLSEPVTFWNDNNNLSNWSVYDTAGNYPSSISFEYFEAGKGYWIKSNISQEWLISNWSGCIPEEEMCDGLDNDCDGIIDNCDDSNNCTGNDTCTNGICGGETEICCSDSLDNEGDNKADCLDTDCVGDSSCPTCSPVRELGCGDYHQAYNYWSGSTDIIDNYYGCTIATFQGNEYAYSFMLPYSKTVNVELSGMYGDLDIFIIEDSDLGCSPEKCIEHGANDATFTAAPNKKYYFVVDGNGASSFTIQVDCW